MSCSRRFLGFAICMAAGSPLPLMAADTNARDFFAAPSGTQLGLLYLPTTTANRFNGQGGDDRSASLDTRALVYRHVLFTDACGTLCTPQFIVPLADIEAKLPGRTQSQSQRGLADPQVGGTLFYVNNPSQREYGGLLTLVTLPVGHYDRKQPDVSPGANRWGATFLLNYTRGVGSQWVLESSLEAQLFGRNDDYDGAILKQKPLYRLQAFASYDFTAATYGALRVYHARGGELSYNGNPLAGTRQRYTQLGLELGHALDRQNQLMVSVGKNVQSENTFHGSQAMLRFVHAY